MMLTNQTVTLTTDEVLKTLVTTIEQANLKAVSKALLAHVQNIKRAYAKDKPSLQTMIGAMSWQVRVLRGTQIPPTTADVLLALLSALQ